LLKSCGEPNNATFGVIHGDLNVSNFYAKDNILWIFDFDQAHKNWFGFDIGVVLRMSRFFDESGIAPGFNGDRFRKIFLDAYTDTATGMVKSGHLKEDILAGFELYREFAHTAVAVYILFQAQNGKQFETAIISFCELIQKGFQYKFGTPAQ